MTRARVELLAVLHRPHIAAGTRLRTGTIVAHGSFRSHRSIGLGTSAMQRRTREISPMNLAVRGTLASILVGGLLAVGSVAPTYAVQAPSPLVPEANAAIGARPCRSEAIAAKGSDVGKLRALGDCEIDRRLDTITKLQVRVANADSLTAADRAALQSQLAADTSGLTALRAQIDGESNVDALRADFKKIATDFRVYLLMAPKAGEVISADNQLAAVGRLGTQITKLQARIDAAKAAGKDVTGAQAALDAMNAKVAQVSPLVAGIPAAVLPLTPAQYNAGTAKPILVGSRTSIQSGRGLLAGARADARACLAALKALR
jgi:hypothetical protein